MSKHSIIMEVKGMVSGRMMKIGELIIPAKEHVITYTTKDQDGNITIEVKSMEGMKEILTVCPRGFKINIGVAKIIIEG